MHYDNAHSGNEGANKYFISSLRNTQFRSDALCSSIIFICLLCVFFYLCFESTVNFPFYVSDSLKSIHSKQPNINETTRRKRMLLTTYYSRCFHVWTFNFQLSSLCFEVSNMGCFLCRFVCIKKTSLTSHSVLDTCQTLNQRHVVYHKRVKSQLK